MGVFEKIPGMKLRAVKACASVKPGPPEIRPTGKPHVREIHFAMELRAGERNVTWKLGASEMCAVTKMPTGEVCLAKKQGVLQ